MIAWLKKEHRLNHMQAQFIMGIYLNKGKPVYIDESNLMENHLTGFRRNEIKYLFHITEVFIKLIK